MRSGVEGPALSSECDAPAGKNKRVWVPRRWCLGIKRTGGNRNLGVYSKAWKDRPSSVLLRLYVGDPQQLIFSIAQRCPVQVSPSVISDPDLEDMAHKETSALLEKLTGRVTAIEKKLDAEKPESSDRIPTVALGVSILSLIAVPIALFAWLEPHLHADLRNDVTIEVTNQLKDPLKQIGDIAGDVREIKGKLAVLDPLIRDLTMRRISDAGNLNSNELVALLPELASLAKIAKTESVKVKPEDVEKVGKKLVEIGSPDAWYTAIDFVNYKSFLNVSLSVKVSNVIGTGTLTTIYETHPPSGMQSPRISIAGAVFKEKAAQFRPIAGPDPNESLPVGNDWIMLKGGGEITDGYEMKKVILQNVFVSYHGGPLRMQDVYFLNCTFDVRQQSNGQRLVLAVLDPSPSTTLATESLGILSEPNTVPRLLAATNH
jgi:hypothetical protein